MLIFSDAIPMKLSHRLIIVESVNTQWIFIFFGNQSLVSWLTANSDKCINGDFMSLNTSGPNSVLRKVGQCRSKSWRESLGVSLLGTFSKEQFFKVMTVDIMVVNTMKERY